LVVVKSSFMVPPNLIERARVQTRNETNDAHGAVVIRKCGTWQEFDGWRPLRV
jgi:hypothetical protein